MSLSRRRYTPYVLVAVMLLFATSLVRAENNIEFLDKAVINRLNTGIYEVVTPKSVSESDKIQYAQELPFDKLSYKERNEKYYGIGTAFFIDDKRLMSAAHVFGVEEFSLIHKKMFIRDASGNVYPIKNIREYSSVRDMIIFDLEKYPPKVSPLISSSKVEIGDTVFSVGNVQGEGISFRAGQVAAFTMEDEFGLWKNIRFTSPASPGNSGGPLVNVDGEVVGLIVKKNSSENHNIAYPISEMNNLSGKADFLYRNISMYLNDEQNSVVKTWKQSFKLPATIMDLAKTSQTAINNFYSKLSDDLDKKYESNYFPKGPRFRDYLHNQQFVRQFGVLKSDADFNKWTLSNYRSRVIPLDEDQDLILSKSDIADFHLIIEKPTDTPLKDFITNQKLIMDTLLKGFPLKRDIGVEKIRITSLGKPEKTTVWEDSLGRVWTSSLWFINFMDAYLYSHCLPYPKGVICNIDIKQNYELHHGYFDLVKQNYDEIVIGYDGEVKDWLEYFSLDKKMLPESMRAVQLTLDGDRFKLKSEHFRVSRNDGEISQSSNLHFHFGYANEQTLSEDLLLFEIYPFKSESTNYRIQKYHSPGKFSDDAYQTIWSDIINNRGDFAGELVEKSGSFYVNQPRAETQSTTKDGSENILVFRCFHNKMEDNIVEQCRDHSKSIEFF